MHHIFLATGDSLPVFKEPQDIPNVHSKIFVGETKSAAILGIESTYIPREAFVMRSVGNDLFILGHDSEADPLDFSNPSVGTLFGVYEFLEKFVGVRWLWPGPLGAYVLKTQNIRLTAIKQFKEPALAFRRMRNHSHTIEKDSPDALLGFSPEVARDYHQALNVLYRRHRQGGWDAHPPTGHNKIDWRKYGELHPEWFALTRDGRRGNPRPDRDDPQVSLCVTNEELQDFIIDQWDGKSTLIVGPEDAPGRCTCEKCRAWDKPTA